MSALDPSSLRLRHQSLALRLALSCFILILAGGYAAALFHMYHHLEQKDDEKGLTLVDVIGTYQGVDKPAPILRALSDPDHRNDYLRDVPTGEIEVLRNWLDIGPLVGGGGPDPIQSGYDFLAADAPEDALTPADILDERCVRCHAERAPEGTEASRAISLERLPDVQRYAYSKKLDPVSVEILATSTHTHALSMPLFALAASLLFLLTAWPRFLRHGLIMLCFVGLLLDFAGMWLARPEIHEGEGPIWLILVGGGLFGACFTAMLLGALVDLWLLPRSGRTRTAAL
jgi:hypothetical protein